MREAQDDGIFLSPESAAAAAAAAVFFLACEQLWIGSTDEEEDEDSAAFFLGFVGSAALPALLFPAVGGRSPSLLAVPSRTRGAGCPKVGGAT